MNPNIKSNHTSQTSPVKLKKYGNSLCKVLNSAVSPEADVKALIVLGSRIETDEIDPGVIYSYSATDVLVREKGVITTYRAYCYEDGLVDVVDADTGSILGRSKVSLNDAWGQL